VLAKQKGPKNNNQHPLLPQEINQLENSKLFEIPVLPHLKVLDVATLTNDQGQGRRPRDEPVHRRELVERQRGYKDYELNKIKYLNSHTIQQGKWDATVERYR